MATRDNNKLRGELTTRLRKDNAGSPIELAYQAALLSLGVMVGARGAR